MPPMSFMMTLIHHLFHTDIFKGLWFFIGFVYALSFTYDKYIMFPKHKGITGSFLIAILVGFISLYFYFKKSHFKSSALIKTYTIVYLISWISLLSAIGLSHFHGWYFTTFYSFLILNLARAF